MTDEQCDPACEFCVRAAAINVMHDLIVCAFVTGGAFLAVSGGYDMFEEAGNWLDLS